MVPLPRPLTCLVASYPSSAAREYPASSSRLTKGGPHKEAHIELSQAGFDGDRVSWVCSSWKEGLFQVTSQEVPTRAV